MEVRMSNPGRGSIIARYIGSRLYRVETVVGYTLVQFQPPRQKMLM
jgi:hypothetical protein